MATTSVTKGSFLYLLPEDVPARASRGFYAEVLTVTRGNVAATAVADDGPHGRLVVPRSGVTQRVVPPEEVTGSRTSAWLRQAVACLVGDDVHFGQVIATNGDQVQVATVTGKRWIPAAGTVGPVHDLTAMLLYDGHWSPEHWTERVVRRVNDRLLQCMREHADGEDGERPTTIDEAIASSESMVAPSIPVILARMEVDLSVDSNVRRQWVERETGQMRETTIEHALNFVFFYAHGRVPPFHVRRTLGSSICDDSRCMATSPAAAVPRAPVHRNPSKAKRSRRAAFFDEFVRDNDDGESDSATDEEEKTSGPPPAKMKTRVAARPLPMSQRGDPSVSSTGDAIDDKAAFLQRLAQDPEAFKMYWRLRAAGTAPVVGTSQGLAAASTARSRHGFSPSEAQVEIHQIITCEEHRGTSPSSFSQLLLSSSAITFERHPGIIMRLFDFGFGPRGLSVMHLVNETLAKRMERQRSRQVSMEDFSGAVKIPASASATTWSELQNGVNGLFNYCTQCCDETTTRIMSRLAGFVSSLQVAGIWPEHHLSALEFWVNEQLFAYRELVDADARHRTNRRVEALTWFEPSNPTLMQLYNMTVREDLQQLHDRDRGRARNRTGGDTCPGSSGVQIKRQIPSEVTAAIPKRDGRELCLKFASKKGCSKGDGERCPFSDRAHFVETLPSVIKQFIILKFGGLADAFQRQ